jgi:anti-sigma regulatory factor (Ser/Thr protein kinase)
MMTEISLNILDVAENSVKANASLIKIEVEADYLHNLLTLSIADNGCGMSKEQTEKVTDPFYTTRTTRKVGLGIPFLKGAAEAAEGTFSIESEKGKGTKVVATFKLDSIDRMPLGDICATMHTLITMHEDIDFLFVYGVGDDSFSLDTREFREILGEVSFKEPEVSNYIRDYLKENIIAVNGEKII